MNNNKEEVNIIKDCILYVTLLNIQSTLYVTKWRMNLICNYKDAGNQVFLKRILLFMIIR